MSYKKIIFILALVLATGWSACTREKETPEPKPGPGTIGEEAYLTFGMNLSEIYDDIITRAEVDSVLLQRTWGLTEENFVSTVRLVLYGYEITGSYEWEGQIYYEYGLEDVVRYAFDFNIESKVADEKITGYQQFYYGTDNTTRIPVNEGASGWPSSEGRPHLYKTTYSATSGGGENTATGFITWARPVMADDYKMLLIINPTSISDATLQLNTDVTEGHDLYRVTAIGKPLTLLEDALEVKLSNMRDPDKAGFAAPNYFLMTNHQGDSYSPRALISVGRNQLHSTETMANENPVPVSVSRVVAKVTVAKDENMAVSPSGASIANIRWDLSATNKMTYWMRKMAKTTDNNDEKIGDGNTGNRLRLYADDPNPSPISSKSEKEANFNYLNGQAPALHYYALDDLPEGDDDAECFGYILENTMSQHNEPNIYLSQSDEWTTLWISCQYAPPGFSIGESYYVWNGYILTVDLMQKYATDPNEIPPIPALANLAADIAACSKELQDPQTASFADGNFQYFHDGLCYYSFVIEHNTETMVNSGNRQYGYGYYGVVRNIQYPHTISKVSGPGLPVIDTEEKAYGYMTILVGMNEWEQREQQSNTGKPATELP